jgi:outer membrane protein TolC
VSVRGAVVVGLSLLVVAPVSARAQVGSSPATSSPFLGGVSSGAPGAPLPLTLGDAIARGLEHNLGVLLQQQSVTRAEASRWKALSDLLPDVSGDIGEARRKTSLAEFGFTQFPGINSRTIGPFDVFTARLSASQPVLDLSAVYGARAGTAGLRAARYEMKDARDLVVLVVSNLYLEAIASASRVTAAQAELQTADALLVLARDLKTAGLAAGVDVLRAQVQQQSGQQRLIAAEVSEAKARLNLGRAIGVPPGQVITLTDQVPYAPLDTMDVEAAVPRALASRGDYLAAQARLDAAEAEHRSAVAERLPTITVDGSLGHVGTRASDTDLTYAVGASVHVPVFEHGKVRADVLEADALLGQRRAELADARARIDVEVRSALLDLHAAAQALDVARQGVALAGEQLQQSRDRFQAGVAGSLEVVQAQASVAAAQEQFIAGLYAHNLAKLSLARVLGIAETSARQFLGGGK